MSVKWTHEPPEKHGKYWVRWKDSYDVFAGNWDGHWLYAGGNAAPPTDYQFGPQVLSAEETVELLALVRDCRNIQSLDETMRRTTDRNEYDAAEAELESIHSRIAVALGETNNLRAEGGA